MPIEIKELHIKVAVNVPQTGQSSEGKSAAGAIKQSANSGADKDEIVAECVEQVLQILQHKKER